MVASMVVIILHLLVITINGINLMTVLLLKWNLSTLLPVLPICCSMRGNDNDYLRLCYILFISCYHYLILSCYLINILFNMMLDMMLRKIGKIMNTIHKLACCTHTFLYYYQLQNLS